MTESTTFKPKTNILNVPPWCDVPLSRPAALPKLPFALPFEPPVRSDELSKLPVEPESLLELARPPLKSACPVEPANSPSPVESSCPCDEPVSPLNEPP